MGWRNRSWQTKSRRARSRRPLRPPLPPPYYHGYKYHPVPLWEREFCNYVGAISWQRFSENKKFVPMYKNIEQWDDSEAFENFQNAKARFWANYHGLPSDIPLPYCDMYIDMVDHHCKIDPELVADLDKEQQPFETYNKLVPTTGLGKTEAENNCTQNQSGNWDIYVEKPAEVNNWETRSSSSRGMNHERSNKWSKNCSGWGDALVKPNWGSSNNNHYSSNKRNSFYGVSNNRYQDPSSISGRKRNRVDTSSKETIYRGTRLRGTKEVDGKIREEEIVNSFHLTTGQMIRE